MSAEITVNGNTIDTEERASTNAADTDFILIKSTDILSNVQKQQLTSLGVNIQEYVSESTYLCKYAPSNLQQIRDLPFIQAANPYERALKTTSSLKQMITSEERTDYEIDVLLHSGAPQSSQQVARELSQRIGVDQGDMEVAGNMIRLTVNQAKIPDIEKIDSVNRIEEVRPQVLFNDLARQVLFTNDHAIGAPSANHRFQGKNQIVAVADTGVDPGHQAFSGKFIHLQPLWLPRMEDTDGHGTHVCGSVLGRVKSTDSAGERLLVQGTAPEAQLVMQSLWFAYPNGKWGLRIPLNREEGLFGKAMSIGASIHSNSWGPSWPKDSEFDDPTRDKQLGYDAGALALDRFVNTNPEFVALVAAGNDGTKNNGRPEIGGHSIAKNSITVGATLSSRPTSGVRYDPNSKQQATDTSSIALYSSRGPTKSSAGIPGRIKPDVMAPDTAILSAGSGQLSEQARQTLAQDYGKWAAENRLVFMTGTSMATPLVAGCVAVIREALTSATGGNVADPSAALVKAILINGTVDIQGKHAPNDKDIPPAPNGEQGFGRVDLGNSLVMTEHARGDVGFVDAGDDKSVGAPRSLRPGQSWTSNPIPVAKGKTFKATLAYSDPEGERLQNKLNLIVKAGDGERHGNMGTGADFDQVNNVEKVVWEEPPAAFVTIEVRVAGLTALNGVQAFSVAWMSH